MSTHPIWLIDRVDLANGRQVTVRPVLPQDAELQDAFVRNLSAESRYQRFLTPIRELTPHMLDRLMQVDHQRHVALIAEANVDGRLVQVAEARYVLDAAGDAEFAIAVADDWQGLGLGRLLMGKLEAVAVAAGVQRMVGDTLRTNAGMLGLARRGGYHAKSSRDSAWLIRMEKALDAAPARLAA